MKYYINNKTAPNMPTLGKGTECIQIIPSQASKTMLFLIIPMYFPYLVPRCVFLNFNISTSLDRTLGPNGHPQRRNRRYQGPFVRSGRGLLSPISRARRGGTEETRRVATKGMGGVCCSSVRPLFVRSPTNKRRPPNEG